MKNNRWFSVFYMLIVTAFFSSIIIGLSIATREQVKANETLALEKAVLQVLPGLYEEGMSGVQIHQRFMDKVAEPSEKTGNAWAMKNNSGYQAYAVPLSGQGFWASIKGVIGIAEDRKTVTGIAFYEQNETPGLGAEIEKASWRAQFSGKKLSDGRKVLNMKRPGETAGEHEVNAVTGATQTSVRLGKIIDDGVTQWRQKLQP
jgi:Na+-transporting NADH:ubiquinone oxidoreductase subunit C